MKQRLTPEILQGIGRRMSYRRATEIAAAINAYVMPSMSNINELAAFLAQAMHETNQFYYREEIWGPTAQQRKYEPGYAGTDLWKKLGNTQKGDGYRFRGRGWFQLTGRSNYAKGSSAVGVDLIANPDAAAEDNNAAKLALDYWVRRGIPTPARSGDINTVSQLVNGGWNGLTERRNYYFTALKILTEVFSVRPTVYLKGAGKAAKYIPWDGNPTKYDGYDLNWPLVEKWAEQLDRGTSLYHGPDSKSLLVEYLVSGDIRITRSRDV